MTKKKLEELFSPHPAHCGLSQTHLLTHEYAQCALLPGVTTSVKSHKPIKLVTILMAETYPSFPPSCTSKFALLLFRQTFFYQVREYIQVSQF